MSARSAVKHSLLKGVVAALGAGMLVFVGLIGAPAAQAVRSVHATTLVWVKPHSAGGLDCNGFSPIQKTILAAKACSDVRGFLGVNNQNTWGGRFYDNGHYIGHDEPDVRFMSSVPGSGNNTYWNETLGRDPAAAPTVKTPGKDVTHYVELTVAPWFSMALCNPYSYPLLPCTANSDGNAPAGKFPGGGSSFLEMQFYPPGMAPFADSISCDNTHWCASLHINDLEATANFNSINTGCEEPTNFAFIQKNGVPTGPPSPQLANLATFTQNSQTLLMNPGDHLKIHIWDAPVPGHPGKHALMTSINDLTTRQSGFMQASAANGFMATRIADCSGTPWNYQPEYNTSAPQNIVPWAALQVNTSTQFEIGHFEACRFLTQKLTLSNPRDVTWNQCHGPYENGAPAGDGPKSVEAGDAPCYPKGDTHFGRVPPNIVTGCEQIFFSNGDLDFDGNSYYPDWPNSTVPNRFPSTFIQAQPTTTGGATYSRFQIQTDTALSESTCHFPNPGGCKVPPPNAPGHFFPYWTLSSCHLEFGNMTNGNTFGKDKQYGVARRSVGYAELLGPIMTNPCAR